MPAAARPQPVQSHASIAEAAAEDTLVSMLLREKVIDAETLERSRRLLGKLGTSSTLFGVLSRTSGLTDTELLDCVRRRQPDIPIGALLVELGLINRDQLRQALQLQSQDGNEQKIGEILVARRMLRERDLTRALAAQHGFECEEPEIDDCDAALLSRISTRHAERFDFLPLRVEDDTAVVAFADPLDQEARTEAARVLAMPIRPVTASRSTLRHALAALVRQRTLRDSGGRRTTGEDSASARVDALLAAGIAQGASDIHVEPLRDRVRVRLRIDGTLREHAEFAKADLDALITRLKVLAEADIAERRRHQDGRIGFENPSTGVVTDLRASFYVTVNGECAVLRVLNQSARVLALDEIGMAPLVRERFELHALEAPSGVIIITGPTGSGKTSTLYGCVNHLNNEMTSIITAEDPVELRVEGISQCSTNDKLGRTFTESLRHIVRQDPDIIVLGEIRDASAAESAIQAALTGHKVLTTFHTEDSIGALLRLLNMNVEPFLIASTVSCVVAQRLVRRVCAHCARPYEPEAGELRLVGCDPEDVAGARFVRGDGCAHCHFGGYAGRVAVFESLVLSEAVREAVLERATALRVRRAAIESAGLLTLIEDGLVKASRGETTIAEIRRTLPQLARPRPLRELRRLAGRAA